MTYFQKKSISPKWISAKQDHSTSGKGKTTGRFFLPRLSFSAVSNIYEKEDNAMAERVTRMPEKSHQPAFFSYSTSLIQSKCTNCEEEGKGKVRRKEANTTEIASSSSSLINQAISTGGQSLDRKTKSFMESRFGYNFSAVKVHTGPVAAKSASAINALAYTSRNSIVFNAGQYAPETPSGKRLLAHELTHVVQQSGLPGNTGMVQMDKALDGKEEENCLKKVERVIKKLEESARDEDRKLPLYIKKSIKLLRERKDQDKIKCYTFEGIKHGTVDFENEEIRVDGRTEGWINETTLLHEAVHALHGKEFNRAAQKYQKSRKEGKKIDLANPSKEDLELLKFKAWTEYWAYRSRLEYHNQTRSQPFTEDEIDDLSIKHQKVRIHVNRVRRHDSRFHPKTWSPKK